MMPQDVKNHIKPIVSWSMEDLAQDRSGSLRRAAGGGCGPPLKLASRASRTLQKEELEPYPEHAFTHQGGLADLDAAAAAADPFHSGICFPEPFVVAIGRLVVVDKGETG